MYRDSEKDFYNTMACKEEAAEIYAKRQPMQTARLEEV